MDPALKKCDYCGFMPNTVAHQERSEPLERRIAELEAEVSRLRSEGFRHGSSNCGVPFQEESTR